MTGEKMPPLVSLPWRVVTGDNCTSVYVLDAEDDVCIRMRREDTEIAHHIVNCVNAFKGYSPFMLNTMMSNGFTVDGLSKEAFRLECALEEKTNTGAVTLDIICAHHGDTSAVSVITDSDGGHCD